jgi:hypothetical protein
MGDAKRRDPSDPSGERSEQSTWDIFRGMDQVAIARVEKELGPSIRRFCEFYDGFSPEWVERLEEIYHPQYEFHDPFHDFSADMPRMKEHFSKIFKLAQSKFIVEDAARGGDGAYVRWTWEWKWKPKHELRVVPGVTHIRLSDDGRVAYHRDLFDAAYGFFEVVPVVGGMIRAVKKRL